MTLWQRFRAWFVTEAPPEIEGCESCCKQPCDQTFATCKFRQRCELAVITSHPSEAPITLRSL